MRRRCASGCEGIGDLCIACQSLVPCRDSSLATAPIQATASPESTLREALRTATPAERVRLVVALAEAGGTLRCSGRQSQVLLSWWLARDCGWRRTHFGLGTV